MGCFVVMIVGMVDNRAMRFRQQGTPPAPQPTTPRVDTSSLAGVSRASQPTFPRLQLAPPPDSPAPSRQPRPTPSRPAVRQPTPPRLSAINKRLAPPANESSPSMRVRDPNEKPNPVTSFLGGLFEPRVPTPTYIETNQPGVFSNRNRLEPIDSRYRSLSNQVLPPPPLSYQDEMATNPAGWGMPVMRDGEPTMLYNNITLDDWGRLVVAPGYSEVRDPRLPTYSGLDPVLVPYRPSEDELERKRYG